VHSLSLSLPAMLLWIFHFPVTEALSAAREAMTAEANSADRSSVLMWD
jgi:hypothetical protein